MSTFFLRGWFGSKIAHKKDTYHHGNLHQACVDQGLKFLDKGNADFSLRDIAREVGVSHGAPSRHFGTKEGLFAAIAEEGFRKFHQYLKDSRKSKDLKKDFFEMGRAYILFGLDHPSHYRVMLGGSKIENHHDYEGLSCESRASFMQLVELIKEMQESKIFREGNTLELAYCIWSAVHGLVMLSINNNLNVGVSVNMTKPETIADQKKLALRLMDNISEAMYQGLQA